MEHKSRGRKMFCWKCGKEIPDEALFCSYCGTEVKSTGVAKTDAGAAKTDAGVGEKRDYRAFVAIGLIILLLLAAATILIGTLSNREEADTAAETPLPAEGSPTAAESPAPAETPAPTEIPEPTETSRPRFISPEQYARENGLDWPEGDYDPEYTHSDFIDEYYGDEPSIWRIIKDTVQFWDNKENSYDEVTAYAEAYMQARADGKNDLEAHEIGLEETGIDRRILGKEEYVQYIYDSAISAGVSEYDAEEFMEQEKLTWDTAWSVYKYARDNGSGHEQAIGSVDWKFLSDGGQSWMRMYEYKEQGMDRDLIKDKLYSCLQYWYEIKREDIEA